MRRMFFKYYQIFIPTITAYILTVIIFKNYDTLILNLGSLWINIKVYYVVVFGLVLTYIILKSKKKVRVNMLLLLFLLLVILFALILVDSFDNLNSHSLTVFIIFLIGTILFLKKQFKILY